MRKIGVALLSLLVAVAMLGVYGVALAQTAVEQEDPESETTAVNDTTAAEGTTVTEDTTVEETTTIPPPKKYVKKYPKKKVVCKKPYHLKKGYDKKKGHHFYYCKKPVKKVCVIHKQKNHLWLPKHAALEHKKHHKDKIDWKVKNKHDCKKPPKKKHHYEPKKDYKKAPYKKHYEPKKLYYN